VLVRKCTLRAHGMGDCGRGGGRAQGSGGAPCPGFEDRCYSCVLLQRAFRTFLVPVAIIIVLRASRYSQQRLPVDVQKRRRHHTLGD